MKLVLFTTLAILITGCSARWHLAQAEKKGVTFATDTVTRDEFFTWPEQEHDTIFWLMSNTDTVTIETERTIVKTKIDTVHKRVYQYIKEKADTIHDVDTIYKTVIKPGEKISRKGGLPWWGVVVIVLLVTALSWIIVRKV